MSQEINTPLAQSDLSWLIQACNAYNQKSPSSEAVRIEDDKLAVRLEGGKAVFYKTRSLKPVCICSLINGQLTKEMPRQKGLEKFIGKIAKISNFPVIGKAAKCFNRVAELIDQYHTTSIRGSDGRPKDIMDRASKPQPSDAENRHVPGKPGIDARYPYPPGGGKAWEERHDVSDGHQLQSPVSSHENVRGRREQKQRKHRRKAAVAPGDLHDPHQQKIRNDQKLRQPDIQQPYPRRKFKAWEERCDVADAHQPRPRFSKPENIRDGGAYPARPPASDGLRLGPKGSHQKNPGAHGNSVDDIDDGIYKEYQAYLARLSADEDARSGSIYLGRTHFPENLPQKAKKFELPLLVPEQSPYTKYHHPESLIEAYQALQLKGLDSQQLRVFIKHYPVDSATYFHAYRRGDISGTGLSKVIKQLLNMSIGHFRPLELTGAPLIDAFRKAWNAGFLNEDIKYVSVIVDDNRLPAQILGFNGGGVMVRVCLPDGRFAVRLLKGDALENIKVSPDARSRLAPSGKYTFRSHKLNNYMSRSGASVTINYRSPTLQKWMASATRLIAQKAGISPGQKQRLTSEDHRNIISCWLNLIVPLIEDKNSSRSLSRCKYGGQRSWIIDNNKGSADIGTLLESEAAVCRELSIFASILLAEYGIRSKVVTGNMYGGAHAWIKLYRSNGDVYGILDSNNTRRLHSAADYAGTPLYETALVMPH